MAALAADGALRAYSNVDGAVASSGDVGFTYGRAERVGAGDRAGGYYLRAWRVGPAGTWQLVFDTVSR
jgi:hypothetical protein